MTDLPADNSVSRATQMHGISFGEAFHVWLKIALLSFGGPAGQIAVMHRVLVDEKRWISESRFLHALNYCMLLPGPEAQQLATYIGWLLHRTAGGIIAGGLFIVPGVIAIMGLSYIYAGFGHVGFIAALFFGLIAIKEVHVLWITRLRVTGESWSSPRSIANIESLRARVAMGQRSIKRHQSVTSLLSRKIPETANRVVPVKVTTTASEARPPAIGDYGIIGDCRTAALVARDGSIGWLCLPDFSSPSIFGEILDRRAAGHCWIRPHDEFSTRRRYVDNAPILETTFETRKGSARLIDLVPVVDGIASVQPMREILRIVEGVSGEVDFEIRIEPRPDYGRKKPCLTQRGRLGWSFTWSNELLTVGSDVDLSQVGEALHGTIRVRAGDRLRLSLSYVKGDVGVLSLLGQDADERCQHTSNWWQGWFDQCSYQGSYRDAVTRSALVLKLLSFSLSGAIIAAPTTSLPEAIGGKRNWDYRYCWLRDAGLTMQALIGLGFHDEARGFLSWLLHATRLSRPELHIMYDVYGRTGLREQELDHLEGYRGSKPVRIGNGAYLQSQLDVYGEVVMAADAYLDGGGALEPVECRMLVGVGKVVCKQWRNSDHGIWEMRGAPKQLTFSKVMCWLALDRLLKFDENGVLSLGKLAEHFRAERQAITDVIEHRGFNSQIGAYTDELDGSKVDASLLLMPCIGYLACDNPRMISTYQLLSRRLGQDGLFYRNEARDNDEPREGAFGICSFWAVQYLACRGDAEEAQRLFEHLLSFANDVGLFGEEIDPHSGAALGNFPQAFTHIGLINAALAIERALKGRN